MNPPDTLLIRSDQQRVDWFGFDGQKVIAPHLDRLTKEGTRFSACITSNPMCQPTGSLECVKSSADFGPNWFGPYMGFQYAEMILVGHNWFPPDKPPLGLHYEHWCQSDGQGDEKKRIFQRGRGDTHGAAQTCHSHLPVAWHNSTWTADRTIEWLKQLERKEKPFCAWVSVPDPHHPFDCPEPWSRLHAPEDMDLPKYRTLGLDLAGVAARLTQHGEPIHRFLEGQAVQRGCARSAWELLPGRVGLGLRLRWVRTRNVNLTLEPKTGVGEMHGLRADPNVMRKVFGYTDYAAVLAQLHSDVQGHRRRHPERQARPVRSSRRAARLDAASSTALRLHPVQARRTPFKRWQNAIQLTQFPAQNLDDHFKRKCK